MNYDIDAVARITAVHDDPRPHGHSVCRECGYTWPCEKYLLAQDVIEARVSEATYLRLAQAAGAQKDRVEAALKAVTRERDEARAEVERLTVAIEEAIAAAGAAVAVGWELVKIPEGDEVFPEEEDEDPQCTCEHPVHHAARCANEADNGGLCLPCIHGCSS